MNPDPPLYYRRHVFCCVNTRASGHPRGCCSTKGAIKLRAHMKARAKGLPGVRVNAAQCLDRCERGPTVVIYPEGVWYSVRTTEDVDEIVETHLAKGRRVDRLMLRPDDAVAPR